MKTCVQLLYKTFYDFPFVKNYVKNGKGNGTGLMAFLALVMSIILTASFFYLISPLYNTNYMTKLINEQTEKLPDLTITDGQLALEEEAYYEFKISDFNEKFASELTEQENMTILIINTVDDNPNTFEIKKSIFYLTRTTLYINSNGEIKETPLARLQKTFGESSFNPLSQKSMEAALKFAQTFMVFILALMFIFGFFMNWVANTFLAIITRFFSSISSEAIEKLGFSEKRRAAAAAVTPTLLVIVILQSVFSAPGSFVKWAATIIIGVILMSKYTAFEPKEEKAEKPSEKQ
ncbi:MAG: DUF1189 domain-containing protein [Lactobacillaceae bacterium]|jgi:hypothetical protein|nr:DUF1189 domain-containing protein [Lactobacillaceae bacterium]